MNVDCNKPWVNGDLEFGHGRSSPVEPKLQCLHFHSESSLVSRWFFIRWVREEQGKRTETQGMWSLQSFKWGVVSVPMIGTERVERLYLCFKVQLSIAWFDWILVGGMYRVLVWGEGCLNGAESTELSLLRSRQLREHFIAMNANTGTTQQSSETSAGNLVSPQDLTPMEWFYLCSMGCRFPAGAGYSLILQRKTISSFMWINEKLFLISGW